MRRRYEKTPRDTDPDLDPDFPWDDQSLARQMSGPTEAPPTWLSVGAPVWNAIWRTSAADVVLWGDPAFAYADALIAAERGDVEALCQRFQRRHGKVLSFGFHGLKLLLSNKEISRAGPDALKVWPGAVWQALIESDALEVPIYVAYEKIRKRAARILRTTLFGSIGTGSYSEFRSVSLERHEGTVAQIAAPPIRPAALLESTSQLLDRLTPAERRAAMAMFAAIENDETLAEWCRTNGEAYAPIQRAFARAKTRLASLSNP